MPKEGKEITIAIVGRPNVGKSRLFNRLAGRRISIVHDQPGVTRDVVMAQLSKGVNLVDTGGVGLETADTEAAVSKAMTEQAYFALSTADGVLFVIDGREPLTSIDTRLADILRAGNRPVLLVVNKLDPSAPVPSSEGEWHALGLGNPLHCSAEHGKGEEDIFAWMDGFHSSRQPSSRDTPRGDDEKTRQLRLCFAGRPNVGKSSLANALLRSSRMIVSEVAGTTRDAVDLSCRYTAESGEEWSFILTDTAGLRHRTKVSSPVEYFGRVRSLRAMERSDLVLLLLDAISGVTAQDKAIAGEALSRAKPLILVVNKWDLALEALQSGQLPAYQTEAEFRGAFSKAVRKAVFFTPGAPLHFISAREGLFLEPLLRTARALNARLDTELPTGQLNACLQKAIEKKPPPRQEGRRFKVYYAVQSGTRPIRIRLFCNQSFRLTDSYQRYLTTALVEKFKIDGCPVVFDLVSKQGASPA